MTYNSSMKETLNLTLRFGNIFGSLSHRISEPVFRFDRYFENNIEYGLQFLYNNSTFTCSTFGTVATRYSTSPTSTGPIPQPGAVKVISISTDLSVWSIFTL